MLQPRLNGTYNNCGLHALTPEIRTEIQRFATVAQYDNQHNAAYEDLKTTFAEVHDFDPGTFSWQNFHDLVSHYNDYDFQVIMGPVLRCYMKKNMTANIEALPGTENHENEMGTIALFTNIQKDTGRYDALGPTQIYQHVAQHLGFALTYHNEATVTQAGTPDNTIATVTIYHKNLGAGHWERTNGNRYSPGSQNSNFSTHILSLASLGSRQTTEYSFALIKAHLHLTAQGAQPEAFTHLNTLAKNLVQDHVNRKSVAITLGAILELQRKPNETAETVESDRIEAIRPSHQTHTVPSHRTKERAKIPDVSSAVVESLSVYTAHAQYLQFPINRSEKIKSEDAKRFLTELTGTLQKDNRTIDCVSLSPCDLEMLLGLVEYSQGKSENRFNTIEITVPPLAPNLKETYLELLKMSLKQLSQQGLDRFQVIDPHNLFTEKDWESVLQHIQANEIGMHLDLPEAFATHAVQRQIDEQTENFSWLHRAQQYDQVLSVEPTEPTEENERVKRTRPKLDVNQFKGVDVQLQEEQQVQIAVQTSIQVQDTATTGTTGNHDDENDPHSLKSFEEFMEHVILRDPTRDPVVEPLPIATQLMSRSELQKLWHTINGDIYINAQEGYRPSATFEGITPSAARQIAMHPKQFLFGLDTNHLPPGFTIVKVTRRVYYEDVTKSVLQYNPNIVNLVESDPLAQHFQPIVAPSPLCQLVFREEIAAKLEQPKYARLKEYWEEINSPYDRSSVALFKRHISKLLMLSESAIEDLYEACTINNEFDVDKFSFILTHFTTVSQAFPETVNLQDDPKGPVITERFGVKSNVALNIMRQLSANAHAVNKDHPFYSSDLSAQFERIAPLTNQKLDALLDIYNQYGNHGLEKLQRLFNNLPQSEFDLLNKHIFSKSNTFTPFLDDSFIRCAEHLLTYPENKKSFLMQLLDQHYSHTGEGDLILLIKSFDKFCEVLERYELGFDKQKHFTGIQNMPVALARMLSILGHVPVKDRALQWAEMDKIDLQTDGAVFAMGLYGTTDTNRYLARSALPEMQFVPENYNLGYLSNDTLGGYEFIFLFEPLSDEAFKIEYFRNISHRNSAPMALYRDAYRIVMSKDYGTKTKQALLDIIAQSTLGQNVDLIDDVEQSIQQVNEIITIIDRAQSVGKKVRKIMPFFNFDKQLAILLGDLRRRGESVGTPPLPILTTFLKATIDAINPPESWKDIRGLMSLTSSKARTDFKQRVATYEKDSEQLEQFLQSMGQNVYYGMRFYEGQDFIDAKSRGNTVLHEHVETLNAIDQTNQSRDIQQALSTIISSYYLSPDDIQNINQVIGENTLTFERQVNAVVQIENEPQEPAIPLNSKDEESSRLWGEYQKAKWTWDQAQQGRKTTARQPILAVLSVLQHVDRRINDSQESLNAKHIIDLLGNLPGIIEQYPFTEDNQNEAARNRAIYEMIQQTLGSYFSKEYMASLLAFELDADIHQYVDRLFPINPSHNEKVKALLGKFPNQHSDEKLRAVLDKIKALTETMNAEERTQFFDALLTDGLYTNPDIEQFEALLQTMMDRGGAQYLFYLLEQPGGRLTENLTERALFLMQEVDPLMRSRVQKGHLRQMSDFHSRPLIVQHILSCPIEQINQPVHVARPSDEAIQKLDALLVLIEQQPQHQSLDGYRGLLLQLSWLEETLPEEFNTAVTPLKEAIALLLQQQNKTPAFETGRPVKVTTSNRSVRNALFDNNAMRSLKSIPKRLGLNKKRKPERPTQQKRMFDLKVLTEVQESVTELKKHQTRYDQVLSDIFVKIETLVARYPGAKANIISLKKHFFNGQDLPAIWEKFDRMDKVFTELNDIDFIRALCTHFDGEEADRGPVHLMTLLETLENDTPEQRRGLLKTMIVLLNNEDPSFTITHLNAFRDRLLEESPYQQELATAWHRFYEKAPYPSLALINQWHQAAVALANNNADKVTTYRQQMNQQFHAFQLAPAQREPANGFHMDETQYHDVLGDKTVTIQGAVEISDQITGLDPEYMLSDLESLQQSILDARTKSIETLLEELQAFRDVDISQGDVNIDQLVANAAELLYRAKGKSSNNPRPGDSFEINTTQYLAIHSLLRSGQHVTSGIGTGEGKSRIMMISMACQHALGKTVDFVTSDVTLAERDYLEYKSYFELLGAETNLITNNAPVSDYKMHGINFSDAANLSLFRNKARSQNNGHLVINQQPEKRALMLDEADKTYFDVADTRYNFSSAGVLENMEFVYPCMARFFMENEHARENLYYTDIEACNKAFIAYAQANLQPEQFAKLANLSTKQIESWQQSAMVALHLEPDVDFKLSPNREINTKFGPMISSEALLVSNGRVQPGSKFSFGVHQFLHARLNILKNTHADRLKLQGNYTDETWPTSAMGRLKQQLDQSRATFFIDDEKQIVYSSTSKSLIDDYKYGSLLAATGSPGSIIEQEEASPLFGRNGHPMQFLSVPRHKGLHRIDRAIRLTTDETAQYKAIVDSILEARAKNQPILLVCETDKESDKLYQFIEAELQRRARKNPAIAQELDEILQNRQRIHANSENESDMIRRAGTSKFLTVSTDMVGRGTDIRLDASSQRHGLKVLVTYLPRSRSLEQILGRAGRAGQNGEGRLILNKTRLENRLNIENPKEMRQFFTSAEQFLAIHHLKMDRKSQVERILKSAQTDYRKVLTNRFFDDFLPTPEAQAKRQEIEAHWKTFSDEVDKLWTAKWPELLNGKDPLLTDPEEIQEVEAELRQFGEEVQDKWAQMCQQIGRLGFDSKQAAFGRLRDELPPIKLSELSIRALKNFDTQKVRQPRKIYRQYDPAHDGRAILYARGTKIRGRKSSANKRAKKKGIGLRSPYWEAYKDGEINFNEYWTHKASKHREAPTRDVHNEYSPTDNGKPVLYTSKAAAKARKKKIGGLKTFFSIINPNKTAFPYFSAWRRGEINFHELRTHQVSMVRENTRLVTTEVDYESRLDSMELLSSSSPNDAHWHEKPQHTIQTLRRLTTKKESAEHRKEVDVDHGAKSNRKTASLLQKNRGNLNTDKAVPARKNKRRKNTTLSSAEFGKSHKNKMKKLQPSVQEPVLEDKVPKKDSFSS